MGNTPCWDRDLRDLATLSFPNEALSPQGLPSRGEAAQYTPASRVYTFCRGTFQIVHGICAAKPRVNHHAFYQLYDVSRTRNLSSRILKLPRMKIMEWNFLLHVMHFIRGCEYGNSPSVLTALNYDNNERH